MVRILSGLSLPWALSFSNPIKASSKTSFESFDPDAEIPSKTEWTNADVLDLKSGLSKEIFSGLPFSPGLYSLKDRDSEVVTSRSKPARDIFIG
jgi:hypothetical protein